MVTIPVTQTSRIIYVATVQCFLLEARLRFETAGQSGATLDIEKREDGQAEGSGVSMLRDTFDLSSTTKTIQTKLPSYELLHPNLNPGDIVAFKTSGDLTGLTDATITLLLGINTKDIPVSENV